MENSSELKRDYDNARLLTKLSVIGGIGALVLLIAVLTLSALRGGAVLALCSLPFALALLFAAAAVIYGVLHTQAARENEEKILLAKRMESRALNVEEDVRFTAQRTFEQYCRFAPFIFAVLGVLLTAFLLYRGYGASVEMKGSSIHTALITAVMMMVSVFAGAFFIGQSRMPNYRWLRPVGAWLIAGFAALAMATAGAIFYSFNQPGVEKVCAAVLFWIFAVLGAEFIVNFVIEFYRPRTLAEARPVFESQLLSLFTEPGGVMRNVASALDYQFGFKVSGTWLYGFIERSFFPVVIAWAALFWGFTAIHEVGPQQIGIRETFGCAGNEMFGPGIYWTLPYPFGDLRKFSCTELNRIVIGETAAGAGKRASAPVVLWTNEHGGSENPFIVAVKGEDGQSESSSIAFVRMAIPIEYRIRKDGVRDYAYANADPVKILKMIGEQAASEYFAVSTMDEIMSYGRSQAENAIAKRIQELADRSRLGIEIVRVAIMDAHPPVEKVAPAYQEVIGALEEKETEILKAKAYSETILPEAAANALEIEAVAASASEKKKTVAAAESERFKSQLAAYRQLPSMFRLNAQMEVLEAVCPALRKYVVTTSPKEEVYQLNFETRERLDLVDVDAAELSNSTKK